MITVRCTACGKALDLHCCNSCGGAIELATAEPAPGPITRTWASEDEVTNWAIDWLLERRFAVVRSEDKGEWLSGAEFCRQYAPHLSPTAFCNRLARGNPPHFLARRNAGGRLIELQPNPVLIDWANRPLQAGRRSDLHP